MGADRFNAYFSCSFSILVFIAPSIANRQDPGGAVYVMTNAPEGNEIAVLSRNSEGLLEFVKIIPPMGWASSADCPTRLLWASPDLNF